jgi:hypothetical protein
MLSSTQLFLIGIIFYFPLRHVDLGYATTALLGWKRYEASQRTGEYPQLFGPISATSPYIVGNPANITGGGAWQRTKHLMLLKELSLEKVESVQPRRCQGTTLLQGFRRRFSYVWRLWPTHGLTNGVVHFLLDENTADVVGLVCSTISKRWECAYSIALALSL